MQDATLQRLVKKYIWNSTPQVEERLVNLEDPNKKIDGTSVAELFGASTTRTGVSVDNESSERFSAVWACLRLISGIPSYLPFQIFEKTDSGRKLATNHRLYQLISKKPNPSMTRQVFIERLVKNIIGNGNGFALIHVDSMDMPVAFELIKPKEVKAFRSGLTVSYKVEGMVDSIPARRMIHVPHLGDDIMGKSTIQYMREDVGLEFATQQYGASIFGQGMRPPGLLSTDQNLTDPQIKMLKEHWQAGKASGGDALLSNGLKYQALSIPPDDAQFIESRKFNAKTIARWFGVPNHKINEEDNAIRANVEQQAISFLQDTMAPLLSKIEGEFTDKIFLPSEGNFYTEFNMDAYLRADSQARAEMFRTGIQNGFYTPNEVRSKLNQDVKEGGDELFIQQNMMPMRLAEQVAMKGAKAPGTDQQLKEQAA